jgi:hypothetical protein
LDAYIALRRLHFEAKLPQRMSGVREARPFGLWVEIRDATALEEPLGSRGMETPRPAPFDEGEHEEIVRGLESSLERG